MFVICKYSQRALLILEVNMSSLVVLREQFLRKFGAHWFRKPELSSLCKSKTGTVAGRFLKGIGWHMYDDDDDAFHVHFLLWFMICFGICCWHYPTYSWGSNHTAHELSYDSLSYYVNYDHFCLSAFGVIYSSCFERVMTWSLSQFRIL